jgi:hypothetical protein
MCSLPLTENKVQFYSGACVKRTFGKVSENLVFHMNKRFKEYIKSYAACLIIPPNCCCLAYVIKSNQSVVKRWFAWRGLFYTQLLYVPQIYFVKVVARTIGLFLRIQNLHKHTDDVPLCTVTQLLYITHSHA